MAVARKTAGRSRKLTSPDRKFNRDPGFESALARFRSPTSHLAKFASQPIAGTAAGDRPSMRRPGRGPTAEARNRSEFGEEQLLRLGSFRANADGGWKVRPHGAQ